MTKQAKIVLFACLYIMGIVVTNASNIVVINILLVSLLILLNYKKLITSRYTLVLALIYIVGISNTIAHTKTFDDLSSYTDNIVTVEAKVLNIPSNCMINKTGFFARVTSIQV